MGLNGHFLNEKTATFNHVESEVLRRYQEAAQVQEVELCCPVEYDAEDLQFLPQEIIEKDYGCGNPSKYVKEGETVLDLGSGAGKICYILSKKVGPAGSVIGVDFNDTMLSLARKYQAEISRTLGYRNVRFLKGKIQDLSLDLDKIGDWLAQNPVHSIEDMMEYEQECKRLRHDEPLISDQTIDVIVSNCVLNLVQQEEKDQLFRELFRVLKRGGRAVISDIVCDETPTESIRNNPDLWSGCIAGAFREDQFLKMFEQAGFYGVEILSRSEKPWKVIEGIEFRSMTVQAFRGKEGPCLERNQAVVYKGPWKSVKDDDGHTFLRGQRMALCDKTFHIMTDPHGPYHEQMIPIEPYHTIPSEEAQPFVCNERKIRHPRETKGLDYSETLTNDSACDCGPDCC